ncbi:hypothetical protein CD30_19010 [Ureibacillus massiliensis 4400831 = CIP 108448 = CCUG 49529]|uniref:Uncharacterized protein n=1 Tax=Ureibacillus massiliensis 4400831 = CIP 108448 = CCUG 49529 TaxID=1211035 RepID=A0A0A3INU4_9BACL|nr:hypothetical protein [Ureibacillus massiliensis]KGR86391.1 hypothetical protein CD30_19010 [Ureibacillus massiliensis 4400831 = CIP 108448 = CCUG 49529]
MSTKLSITGKDLNLLKFKEDMDEIVFNYIDTTQKWEKAYSQLDELLNGAVDYFNSHITGVGMPKQNTYWVLFMDITSKLIYFHTLAYQQLKMIQNEDVTKEVLQLYLVAANCIPDVQKLANAEFLMEVAHSYEELKLYNDKQGEFEKVLLKQNNSADKCIQAFYEFTKSFKK